MKAPESEGRYAKQVAQTTMAANPQSLRVFDQAVAVWVGGTFSTGKHEQKSRGPATA
jgi:hypothetical protein